MAGSWKGFSRSLWHPAADAYINPSSWPNTVIFPQPPCLFHQRWSLSLNGALMKIYKGSLLLFQRFPKIKCVLQPQGLSDTCQGLDTYMLWLEIIKVFLEENSSNSKRWTAPPDSVYSVITVRLKTRTVHGSLCLDPWYISRDSCAHRIHGTFLVFSRRAAWR